MLDRQDILDAQGLAGAPRWRQQVFWRTYNSGRRRRRSVAVLGDIAASAVSSEALGSARLLGRMRVAWETVLPPQYAGRCQVESFRWGRLRVAVDCAATKYVLSRQLGEALRTLLNDYLESVLVHSIEYHIAGGMVERTRSEGGWAASPAPVGGGRAPSRTRGQTQ